MTKKESDISGGYYSKKRFLGLAVAFALVAVLAGGNPLIADIDAQDDNCPGAPCQFPADRYAGGIILGSGFLTATEDGVTYLGPDSTNNLPPDSVEDGFADVANIGFNVDAVDDLWFYKTWKTPRSGAQTEDPDNYDDVYVYLDTGQGTLGGTEECTDAAECDLTADVSEISIREIYFEGVGDVRLLDISRVDDRFVEEYWVNDPHIDGECDLDEIVSIFTGVSVEGFCLGAAAPGADFAGIGFTVEELDLFDIAIRGHRFSATREDGVNRELDLEDFYAEIRWGKGHDRAIFPDPDPDPPQAAEGRESEPSEFYGGPAEGFGDGFDDPTRSGGLTMPFECEGNETEDGVGDEDCEPSNPDYRGDIKAGPYDDIYR